MSNIRLFMRHAGPGACLGLLLAAVTGCAGLAPISGASSAFPTLESTEWRLAQPESTNLRRPALRFDAAEGRVSGSGGCNRMTGPYTAQGGQLRVGPLAVTRMACLDSAVAAAEIQFMAALERTARYRIEEGTLILLDDGGTPLLRLRPMPEPPGLNRVG